MVCFAEDAFTRARYFTHPRWVAALADGREAFADDGRPGLAEPSAWLRLAAHCRATGARVVGLRLEFRSHAERPLPDNAAGYFFRTGLVADLGSGANRSFFLVGARDPDDPLRLNVQRWAAPELVLDGEEVRRIGDDELVGPSYIPSD